MAVRPVVPDDAARVAALLAELGHPDNDVETVRKRLKMWDELADGAVFVFEREGDVVGVLAVSVIPFLERDGSWARIVALVTTRSARGKGIGRELTTAAEDYAREKGCLRVEVTSANRREDAHAFYRRMGYENWADRSGRFIKVLT
ncbi:GNAT family N-acetyltransferase [Actinosynnema sp. ALI-1.44]|uniref:GNAT family N-acetyltransferase n=1 Tax=Actinosynnema sp. ALI-1.44 TaxID=1933779 RepID=UPI00097C3D1F|nr:GNAT family N-acetyltransferase [Actinosynnema sp. ALI-1.44]ONI70347.1 GNAT family N-acetyltransferase [Actinosynnema sp. ALI-1.44]